MASPPHQGSLEVAMFAVMKNMEEVGRSAAEKPSPTLGEVLWE